MIQEEIEIEAGIYTKEKHYKDGCRNIPNCWENSIENCCTDFKKTNADFIAGAKWGMEQICKICEERTHKLGKSCAFRSLGNDYCWE